jgi:uncharacterized protein YneF (UPF0154 family)
MLNFSNKAWILFLILALILGFLIGYSFGKQARAENQSLNIPIFSRI